MYLKIGDRRTVYYVPYSHTTTLAAGDLAQGMNRLKKILYTHEVRDAKRVAIDIEQYPCAAAYLRQHRERLEKTEIRN